MMKSFQFCTWCLFTGMDKESECPHTLNSIMHDHLALTTLVFFSQYEWRSVFVDVVVCWVSFFLKRALYFPKHNSITAITTCSGKLEHPRRLTTVSKAVSFSRLPLLHKDNITIKCEIERPFREQWHLFEVYLLAWGWSIFKLSERTVTGTIAALSSSARTTACVDRSHFKEKKSHLWLILALQMIRLNQELFVYCSPSC